MTESVNAAISGSLSVGVRSAQRMRADWVRPARGAEFRYASILANARGFQLNAANTQGCASRIGRYWLVDLGTGLRSCVSNNLVDVLAHISAAPALAGAPDEAAAWRRARDEAFEKLRRG